MLPAFILALTLLQAQGNQSANGVIRGQILVPSVRVSERIQVIVQRSDGPIVARIFSDTTGNFEVRSLVSGAYELIVNFDGYEEARQIVAVGGGIFGNVTVNILLKEKDKFFTIKPDGGAADDVVDLAELSRKYPKKAIQDYEKAKEEIHNANNAKAIELLTSVVKLAPDFSNAHNSLGTVYQKESRFNEAESEYRRARELNPRSADPLVNLGSLYIDEAAARSSEGQTVVGKLLDDALDILEESLKIKRSPVAYYFLGTAYYKSNFYEEAETNFKHALEMEPHYPAGRLMLANIYIKQRRWASALEHLDAYLIENPKAMDRVQIEQTRSKVIERVR